ncbi:hypothetical protein SCUP515_01812 [Seiridium cupressi]
MSTKPVSRYARLNSEEPRRPSSIPRRSNAVRYASPSGTRPSRYERGDSRPRASGRDNSRSRNDSITQSSRNSSGIRIHRPRAPLEVPNRGPNTEDVANSQAAHLVAMYMEKASVERLHRGDGAWSSLDIDWTALHIMIKSRPGIHRYTVEEGLDIVRQVFISEPTDNHENVFHDLREFLESSNCKDMSAAEVEAALIFTRRIVEHFRPYEYRKRPDRDGKTATRPAETFDEMGVASSEDTESRGRTSRRGSFTRAAESVKESFLEGIRRLSRTRMAGSGDSSLRPASRNGRRPGSRDARPGSRDRRRGSRDSRSSFLIAAVNKTLY